MKTIYIYLMSFLMPALLSGQVLQDADFVGNFYNSYAAVKKGNQWAFLDSLGNLSVDFRDDLIYNEKASERTDLGVASQKNPLMTDGLAIIRKMKNGIPWYGFIDAKDNTVIEADFLNVSGFKNGKALAIKVEGRELGRNDVLDKRIVSYKYDVVLIDKTGEVVQYLAGPFPVSVSPKKLREAPEILARRLSENLIAVRNPDKRWEVHKVE
ncbi:WG repeat-containing protein [Salegentibacter sp. HM20]